MQLQTSQIQQHWLSLPRLVHSFTKWRTYSQLAIRTALIKVIMSLEPAFTSFHQLQLSLAKLHMLHAQCTHVVLI